MKLTMSCAGCSPVTDYEQTRQASFSYELNNLHLGEMMMHGSNYSNDFHPPVSALGFSSPRWSTTWPRWSKPQKDCFSPLEFVAYSGQLK